MMFHHKKDPVALSIQVLVSIVAGGSRKIHQVSLLVNYYLVRTYHMINVNIILYLVTVLINLTTNLLK